MDELWIQKRYEKRNGILRPNKRDILSYNLELFQVIESLIPHEDPEVIREVLRRQRGHALFDPSVLEFIWKYYFAVAYDNSDKGERTGSGDITESFTITGNNPILVVFPGHNGTITGITYNGVALTKNDFQNSASYGTLDLWALLNPPTGAHNLVISATAGFVSASWASYTGVKQTGFPDAKTKQDPAAPSSPLTGSVTTVADNCWLVGGFYTAFNTGQNFSAGAGTTLRQSNQYDSAGTLYTSGLLDSNGPKTPPGSKSLAAAFPGAPGDIANIMLSIAPARYGGFFGFF